MERVTGVLRRALICTSPRSYRARDCRRSESSGTERVVVVAYDRALTSGTNESYWMSGCAQFLAKLEANPSLEGHLSVRHGFLTPERAPDHLPSEYEPWDDMGRALPELFFSNRTQPILAAMPVLSAAEDGL